VSAIATDDPVLHRIRDALTQMYGDRIERIVLYGSRARGDFNDESDYDVALFLKDMDNFWREVRRLAGLHQDFLAHSGAIVDVKPYPAGTHRDRTLLMHEIRNDGIDL
jgi:predicted nucleotidyltransferase